MKQKPIYTTKLSISSFRKTGLILMALLLFFLIDGSISAVAISAPIPLTPTDGLVATTENFPPLGIPLFTWSPVDGATRYRLQFSQDIGFSGTSTVEFTTDNTFYIPRLLTSLPNKFTDGVWYWRVRVESPVASDYSTTMTFEKQWAFNNAPVLVAPGDGETIQFYDESAFKWEPVTGAAKYRIQIAGTIDGFAAPLYNTTTLALSHQPLTKLTNGTYYWRVIAMDAADIEGLASEPHSFTLNYDRIPQLIEPENAAQVIFTPTMRWTAVEGASQYRLEYSTSSDFPSIGTSVILTRNTAYTPNIPISNNQNTYWRVQAISGLSVSAWSEVRTFMKRWYIEPILLTPTQNFIHQRVPFFSWTPVPGAAYYQIEIDDEDPNFTTPYIKKTTANPFYTPPNYKDLGTGAPTTWYWRITPFDSQNYAGQTSNTFAYKSAYNDISPSQVYPLYYYTPNDFPPPYDEISMNPSEDRTVPLPLFIWNRVHVPAWEADAGDAYPDAYEIQVATDPNFNTIVWGTETENLSAAPTQDNPFTPNPEITYYWRVCPLVANVCAEDSNNIPYWSQVWATRIDPSLAKDPVPGLPTLIHPAHGAELGEVTPWLQWDPVVGASAYQVQISLYADFSIVLDSETVVYPVYSPTDAFGQRSLGNYDFYSYYWRVRAISGGTPGSWSSSRRYQVASQSQWQPIRSIGDASNQLEIGSDPAADVSANYDLTALYAAQSKDHWYFGFNVPMAPSVDVTYALYLDIDHIDNSGGSSDPFGNALTTIGAHRPEYVIYIFQKGGGFATGDVWIYRWVTSAWSAYKQLNLAGGDLYRDADYIEIQVPNTEIGSQSNTASYSIALLSFPAGSGSQAQDSVPADPGLPGSTQVNRFASVTEKLTLAAPFSDLGGSDETYPSVKPFFWDWSIVAPWGGHDLQIARDVSFTQIVKEYKQDSNTPHWAISNQFWEDDLGGDDTYYWRIRPRYRVGSINIAGAWSEGFRVERDGFFPANLQTSVSFATPTFSWDIAEGAKQYELQVDTDPSFGSPDIAATTSQNSYTPTSTLADGTYYWRVRVKRQPSITNAWSPTQIFTLALPYPENLRHVPAGVANKAPTLCWDPVLKTDSEGYPVLAASKYRLQISTSPSFSTIYDGTITTEQPCFTPTKGYPDGTFYWRVGMMDGQGRYSNYSPAVTFTKQYPVTTLIAPINEIIEQTPVFTWTPVFGAASYKIEISQYQTFSPLYDSITTHLTTFTPTKIYAQGVTYYWRVAIIDKDGKTGPFNDATIIVDPYGYKLYLPLIIQ